MRTRRPSPLIRATVSLSAAWAAVVAAAQVVLLAVPVDGGALGFLQVIAPHIALAGLVVIPVAVVATSRTLRVALAVLLAVSAVRFGGEWLSLPAAPPAGGQQVITLTTWNLEARSRATADTVAGLRGETVDIVLLQELTLDLPDAVGADADLVARYPSRALEADRTVSGAGVLSRHPILEHEYTRAPIVQRTVVDVDGTRITVFNAHPLPARGVLSPGYDPSVRNADLAAIRRRVDAAVAAGELVVLAGDFNIAPTERAFGALADGLTDAHAEAGLGPGWTWRPSRLEPLGLAFVRIDLVLLGPGLRPLATTVRCPPVGDHCALTATLAVSR